MKVMYRACYGLEDSRRCVDSNESSNDDKPEDRKDPDAEKKSDDPSETATEPRRSSHERKMPAQFDDYEVSINFCEALLGEDSGDPKWDEAKKAEMASMEKFGVWKLVPRPSNAQVIRSKWVL